MGIIVPWKIIHTIVSHGILLLSPWISDSQGGKVVGKGKSSLLVLCVQFKKTFSLLFTILTIAPSWSLEAL